MALGSDRTGRTEALGIFKCERPEVTAGRRRAKGGGVFSVTSSLAARLCRNVYPRLVFFMRIPVVLTHRSLWCLGPPRRPNRRRPRPRPRARQEQGSVRGVPGGDWRGGRRGRREHARRGVVDKHERELGRSVCGHVAQCKFQRHRPRAWIVVCFATSFERIRHDACGEVGGYQHHQRLVRGQDLGRMRLAIVRRGGSRAQKRDGAAGVFHQSVQGRHGVQARGDLGSVGGGVGS